MDYFVMDEVEAFEIKKRPVGRPRKYADDHYVTKEPDLGESGRGGLAGVFHKMRGWMTKHPDRARILEAIESIKDLGYLHPLERKALILYSLKVVSQSISLDGHEVGDIANLQDALKVIRLPAEPTQLPKHKDPEPILAKAREQAAAIIEAAKASARNIVNSSRSAKEAKKLLDDTIAAAAKLREEVRAESARILEAARAEAKLSLQTRSVARPTMKRGDLWMWVNDGIRCMGVPAGGPIPEGFVKGRLSTPGIKAAAEKAQAFLREHPERRHRGPLNASWWTNGIDTVRVRHTDTPPEGYRKGRTLWKPREAVEGDL